MQGFDEICEGLGAEVAFHAREASPDFGFRSCYNGFLSRLGFRNFRLRTIAVENRLWVYPFDKASLVLSDD